MTMLQNLSPDCRLVALVIFLVLSAFPQLSAENAKQLMTDACENELRQREQNALWASKVERRTAGHVYREREIDTVDGPVHRLLSVDGHEPSPSERKQDADRLRDLKENPKARLALSDQFSHFCHIEQAAVVGALLEEFAVDLSVCALPGAPNLGS